MGGAGSGTPGADPIQAGAAALPGAGFHDTGGTGGMGGLGATTADGGDAEAGNLTGGGGGGSGAGIIRTSASAG